MHQRFDILLAEHNRLLSNFLSLLLAVRVKEAAQHQTMVHHLQATVRCERINYQLIKHEKPSLTLYVEQLNATASFLPDATLDCVVEVKTLGGRMLLPHYLDASRPEHAWQEMVQLYQPDKAADSAWRDSMLHAHFTGRYDRTALGSGEQGEAVIRHLEVNLHPLAVRITYEGISLIVEYFVTEQQKMSKQSASYRDSFLPLSQAVLDMDGEAGGAATASEKAEREREKQLLGIAGGGGGSSAPHSPKAGAEHEHRRKGMKDRMKGFFHRDKQSHHSHGQHGHSQSTASASAGETNDDLLYAQAAEDDAAVSSAGGVHINQALMGNGGNLPRPIAPAPPHHHHSHSVSTTSSAGSSNTSGMPRPGLSSLSGEQHAEERTGTSLSMPPTPSHHMSLVGRKSRTASSTHSISLSDAERDAIVQQQRSDSSSSSTATTASGKKANAAAASPMLYVQHMRLGASVLSLSYLSGGTKKYNIEDFQGLTVRVKPFTLQKRELTVDQLLRELRNQQLKALLKQVTATLGNFLSYKLGFSKPAGGGGKAGAGQAAGGSSSSSIGGGGAAGGGAAMSSVEESREGDEEYDSDCGGAPGGLSAGSSEASTAVSRTSLRSGLASVGSKLGESRVRALFGDKSKRRKDSDGRDREASYTVVTPQPAPLLVAGAAVSSLAPAPAVPPRPLSALLGASGQTSQLSTAGIHISAPAHGDASGRLRSASSGERSDSRPAALPQSASANSLAAASPAQVSSNQTAAVTTLPQSRV